MGQLAFLTCLYCVLGSLGTLGYSNVRSHTCQQRKWIPWSSHKIPEPHHVMYMTRDPLKPCTDPCLQCSEAHQCNSTSLLEAASFPGPRSELRITSLTGDGVIRADLLSVNAITVTDVLHLSGNHQTMQL